MKKDKSIVLYGEGIDDNSAMFQTTKGLTKLFGKERAVEMPSVKIVLLVLRLAPQS